MENSVKLTAPYGKKNKETQHNNLLGLTEVTLKRKEKYTLIEQSVIEKSHIF